MPPPCCVGESLMCQEGFVPPPPPSFLLLKPKLRLGKLAWGLPNPWGLADCPQPLELFGIDVNSKRQKEKWDSSHVVSVICNHGKRWPSVRLPFLHFLSLSLYFHLFLFGKNKLRKWRGWRQCVLTPSSQVLIPRPFAGEVSLPIWEGFSSLGNGERRKVKSSNTRLQVRLFFSSFLTGLLLTSTLC